MLRGVVKFYKAERKYGFVVTEDGSKVLLHFKNGGQIAIEGGVAVISSDRDKLREPKRDDELIFEVRQSKKGSVAKCWGYANAYDEAVATLPEVRVIKELRLRDRDKCLDFGPEEVWRGKDIREFDRFVADLAHPLRPGPHRTADAKTNLFGCLQQATYRLEVLIDHRWKRYEENPDSVTEPALATA